MDKLNRFSEITKEMAETYRKKNSDYGSSFSQSIKDFGIVAGVVRISDKFNRLKNLTISGKALVNDESIQDTLLDMANYCIMLKMEIEDGEKTKDSKPYK